MGRQKGDGARSKARPSSSSLAASLLPSGTAAVGFGGYIGSSRVDSSSSSPETTDIDGELAQHLKRLARKDPTTKLKALTSLSVLLKERPREDVLPLVPQWVFEYKKLLMDYNREVRRATHDTMSNLVTAVGRDLALHLKSLMGPWWFSQFDPVSEVSQAAKRSFQVAFSAQEKRLDALILCTNEIFLYLEENLALTPQSMSDKAVAQDEMEEMHHQVISSTLLALASLLDILVSMQREIPDVETVTTESKHASKARLTAISFAEKMFSTHKFFLDFLKSQNPAIRSATYSVLSSFIKNIPHAVNDGNFKTLSATILGAFQEKDPACHKSMWDAILLFSKRYPEWWSTNVQKNVLNQFWNFLRSGCFGSQQISFPILVLFLDTLPPKAIAGEKFFVCFFQNLWAGRSPSLSLNSDHAAFFQAFEECFLWVLHNASRFHDGLDALHHFHVTLVQNILVKLLWSEYLLADSKHQENVLPGRPGDQSDDMGKHPNEKKFRLLDIRHPVSYVQDLGKCIIKILMVLNSLEHNVLSHFCATFEESCLEMFRKMDHDDKSSGIERVVEFLFLLEKHAMWKGETWPLVSLIGPTLGNCFRLIRSLDSSDAVRLLSVAVSIFTPRRMVQQLVLHDKEYFCNYHSDHSKKEFNLEHFLVVFKETFIPWCLCENASSINARVDLLLALLENECLSEQWCSIISYATCRPTSVGSPTSLSSGNVAVLAMLLEKVRVGIGKRFLGELDQRDTFTYNWNHEVLDSAAVSVSSFFPPFDTCHVRFLRAVLGGATEDDQLCFLSISSLALVLDRIFKKLAGYLRESSFSWIRDAGYSLYPGANDIMGTFDSYTKALEMARFALEVLDGSLFCMKAIDKNDGLISAILATIFVIDWESSMLAVSDDALFVQSVEKVNARLAFGELVHAFRCKLNSRFWKTVSTRSKNQLKSVLIQSARSAIFKEDKLNIDTITSLCCMWTLEVSDSLCLEPNEQQDLLDELFGVEDIWPCWVLPDIRTGERLANLRAECMSNTISTSGNDKFLTFIDKLISKIGFERVIVGSVSHCLLSAKEDTVPVMTPTFHSRAWLAAEILCSWRWHGGKASFSFLPKLVAHVKSAGYSNEDCLLDSIINILLDGALIHAVSDKLRHFSVWPVLDDEVECVEDPYLRALLSLLLALFKNDVWGTNKALTLFDLLLNRLFIGSSINVNCLRILPFIVNVLIQPLYYKSISSSEPSVDDRPDYIEKRQMDDMFKDWLERTLSFPPINTWQTGQDMEEWFELVISSYPLSTTGGKEALNSLRDISPVEKSLLFGLFQKQRHSPGASQLQPELQILLSKLMAVSVGYCWKEFDEEDWEFVVSHLRRWIGSAVVVMEEVAETVNDTISSASSHDDLEQTVKKIEHAVSVLDPGIINIARNALFTFSLLCGLLDIQPADNLDSLNLKRERWDAIKDRVIEDILRLFFSSGLTEAIASSCCKEASYIIASTRLEHLHFWELVASSVVKSSLYARDKAVKSVQYWGLSKGPVSSLYAILFSARPVSSLQSAAYSILSAEPVSHLAIVEEDTATLSNGDTASDQDSGSPDFSSEENIIVRPELSSMIKNLPFDILEMDLVAQEQVNVFLAWSLLLSYLLSLSSSSSTREKLVPWIQNSASSRILDCLFRHIPLETGMAHNFKKKGVELPAGVSEAAKAATHAIMSGSLCSFVKSLWPLDQEHMASLAGAIFGVMLRVLPAYVRGWFSDLRDRSASFVIECFTKTWCSPPLIEDELLQIKKASFADDNFSVSVSKSANEVIATYTKDETGMDLVIHLPPSYPLRPVDVDCPRSLGISEVKQRKWLLSMMSFVRNQNGALGEAIRIWKSNFDKEFEGVEECPICYSVIHTANHSLPRLACKTCKHKFHAACMYKWFSTSHKSTCPLCQSPF
ncbi:Zinc finger, RING-type [Dillenia turbinata]|uniref:E3 ubiquitin-protein ligase listerin n=1 Tax=Dillenia turbinata TaxID=194707 RepID=A0AAN8VTA6_9MAGN